MKNRIDSVLPPVNTLTLLLPTVFFMVVLIAVYGFITSKTVAGRQIYALGGNRKAANLSGIDTKKVFFWVYVNMGFLSSVAGIVLAVGCLGGIPVLVYVYGKIYVRYRR